MEKIEGEARLRGGVEEGEKNVSGKGRKTEVLEKCGERFLCIYHFLSLYSEAMSRLLPVDHHGT